MVTQKLLIFKERNAYEKRIHIKSSNYIQKEYIQRINNVLIFIDKSLDAELTLEKIAQKGHYSPYHFHRIFKAVIGETLHNYINRRRLEKAAIQLITNESVSVSELAIAFGFSSNASFTKAFKKFFGANPSTYRKEHKHRKIGLLESKIGQKSLFTEAYICNIQKQLNFLKMKADIAINEVPEYRFACITHFGVEGIEEAFERLLKWAIPNGFMEDKNTRLGRIFHDSFKVTSPDKVRMSIALKTDKPFETAGEITSISTPTSRCIVAHYCLKPIEFEQAWSALFLWMNDNGYKKSEGNPFEIYHNDFRTHPEQKFIVDFYIPIH